ncbi:MAG TPA: glycoside hydrolase family 3 N-terminal domain-containing protein, partial [Bacteroidales bacterium]|nr:glycoside hydrolase family 3 N-terminal domain-containing protein [Bacteroidales bacterium]
MLYTGLTLAILISFSFGGGDLDDKKAPEFRAQNPPYLISDTVWVDSVMNSMSLDEKIGQLFMVAAYSNKTEKDEDYINYLVKEHHIGGLIFMQGGPKRQLKLVNRYQKSAKMPLMIAMDAEWGPSMRLDTTILYPRQMMVGAVQDNDLIYRTGKEYARQLRALGVHINFAPVVDVNVNPQNPVINSRAYGEDPGLVAQKAYYFSKGMQDQHVLAVAKHFPGHGDTDTDSHKALPVINHDRNRLDSVELYPFRKLINAGIGGVMVAHLYIPELDPEPNRASTLSPLIVDSLLRKDLGFSGLVFTDALNMKAISDYYQPGEVEVQAFVAGNDILLFPQDVPLAVEKMNEAIENGTISEAELDQRVRKILAAKQWMGLGNDSVQISTDNIYHLLTNPDARLIQREITEHAITLVHNKDNILPVENVAGVSMASLDIGNHKENSFQLRLKDYADVPAYVYYHDAENFGKQGLIDELADTDIVFVSLTNTNRSPSRNFGFSAEAMDVISRLSDKTQVVLSFFGNPYALRDFNGIDKLGGLIVAYNDRELTQDVA